MSLHGSCIICTDYFDSENDISVTPCGHLFHAVCLNQWIKTSNAQRTCPQCRRPLTVKRIVAKLFINFPEEDSSQLDPYVLKNKIDELERFLKNCKKEKSDMMTTLAAVEEAKDKLMTKIKKVKSELKQEQNSNHLLKLDLDTLRTEVIHTRSLADELKEMKQRLKTFENVEVCINGQKSEVDDMLQQYSHNSSSQGAKQLATFCVALKQEYETIKDSRNKLSVELMKLKRDLHRKEQMLISKIAAIDGLEKQITNLQQTEEALTMENTSLKQKLNSLQLAITSPTDTRTAAIKRLISENPAPEFLTPISGIDKKKTKKSHLSKYGSLIPEPLLGSSFSDDIKLSDNLPPDENKPPLYVPETPEMKYDRFSEPLKKCQNNFVVKNTSNSTTSSIHPSTSSDDPQLIRQQLMSYKIRCNSKIGYDGLGSFKRRPIQKSTLISSSSSSKFSSTNTVSLKKAILLRDSKQINKNRFSRLKRIETK